MITEESVKKDPIKLRAILETGDNGLKISLEKLSVKLDIIIGGAIKNIAGTKASTGMWLLKSLTRQ